MTTRSQSLHAELDHPVIDTDAHCLELEAVVIDYVDDAAGPAMADRFRSDPVVAWGLRLGEGEFKLGLTLEERRDAWIERGPFWNAPSRNTLDRATAHLPALMAERLDEMGLDVAIVYPSLGLFTVAFAEDDLRQASARAFNRYYMDHFRPHADRLIPVGVVPMQTPEEAVEELEHCRSLGFRAVVLQEFAARSIPKYVREEPELAGAMLRHDFFGLDPEHDYDVVWGKLVELGMAATFHGSGTSFLPARAGEKSVRQALAPTGGRGSITNHLYNRMGGFALVHRKSATSLFLGGVTRRFPELNFLFCEGGAAWGASLVDDLVGHWQKRNVDALAHLDPANLDKALIVKLIEQYGDAKTLEHLEWVKEYFGRDVARPVHEDIDEFRAIAVQGPDEIVQLFSTFYFGCEGDDPLYATAFRSELLPSGTTLNATYGSDIGHWDVTDMTEALEEAVEPVEEGIVTPDEFRRFAFENPVRLHARTNPDFFRGTRVETAVDEYLRSEKP